MHEKTKHTLKNLKIHAKNPKILNPRPNPQCRGSSSLGP